MNSQPLPEPEAPPPLPGYTAVLLAADSSDHANRGIHEAVALAAAWGGTLTGTHVYAAQMHDARFRQMEGGLPAPYRKEQELERQRDVHDDLITRGLSVISDSYLDQVARACSEASVSFERRHLEGKNYRQLVNEANGGGHDLLVMGALGLGAVEGSRLGTVCQRVARRAEIDTLVIKDPTRSVAEGPILVGVDGSTHAYGALLTALALASRWQVPVQVVAAFDPYYHYVAFNRIAGVLSEEAGKVFRFEEQEQLHEEIIDAGLAKIYQGHLSVAQRIADDYGIPVDTVLLDGKPHAAIERHARETRPSLLVVGKRGIHADPELDIGGNAENLLRNVDCAVLLSQRQHRPRVDRVAEITTSWTDEAEQRMDRVPSFVRDMARMAILRYAQERGHTVITQRIVDEATATLMPARAEQLMSQVLAARESASGTPATVAGAPMEWSAHAEALLDGVGDPALRDNLRKRIEKKARIDGAERVEAAHAAGFLDPVPDVHRDERAAPAAHERAPHWEAPAIAHLMRVPEGFMRDATRSRVEDYAREAGEPRVTLEVVERGLDSARTAMQAVLERQGRDQGGEAPRLSRCPFADPAALFASAPGAGDGPAWTADALALLDRVPDGYCREMTRKAVGAIAAQSEAERIDSQFVARLLQVFESGSRDVAETMPWREQARTRIARAPDIVRGMLVREIEAWAARNGCEQVDASAVDAVKQEWQSRGVFHLDPGDPRSEQ
jgi:nucleotide-binding universal stress UspA family protein